ncbi:MmgE/PrpD family protein [Diaphorobacter sp. HDW4A]|uniref:MmgE/PrpD family protein n=1 Tax=Diaphorobacter sp. HDW4A TaxID=2714924 RepID=UPI00140A3643|nr:MmgE/PrpD family protein [Diaphorobacter sp. HDW4A]QIL80024.1 MmgE/PrpD family protein [Diaphorobacter sp. HDW4A]
MKNTAMMSIARFASSFDASRLDERHYRQVSRALLDTCAAGMAGRPEPASLIAARYAAELGAGSGSRLWGDASAQPVDPEAAALCNGVAAHVLDYDDVTEPMRGHPSVALLPALLALGESVDASGQDLVCAYVVGFEVLCRLSRTMANAHYVKGWHSTSSLGTLAATVACGRLLHLNEDQIADAVGLAIAQSAGVRANFGSMAKSFQAGQCGAAAAVRAVRLARLGLTSSRGALDGAFGFMQLYAQGESLDGVFSDMQGGEELELELIRSGLEIKKYPMCYATHRAVDGLLELRAEHGFSLADIESIRVVASPGALVALIHTRPVTGLEGKFSMQYALTAAALDGAVSLASFTDSAVMRPEIQTALARVTTHDGEGPLSPRWSNVQIALKDGRMLERRVQTLRGSARIPLGDGELEAKVQDCFSWGGQSDAAASFIRAAGMLKDVSVKELLDAMV